MPLTRSDDRIPAWALLKRFALIYLPVAAVLFIAIWSIIHFDEQMRVDNRLVRENSRVQIARERLTKDFAIVSSELNVLAKIPLMEQYLDTGNPVLREELSQYFLLLSSEAQHYDQVRLLDASGREVIRVNFNNGHPAIVPSEQLQDKSGRYYFRDTIKLGQGEMYVSPLDLNIEHDQIELPYKPMIRFGVPLFDNAGRKKGVLLFNYLGSEVLRDFRESMQGGDVRQGMLLNRDGYWLSSPNPEDEWGFMFGRNERTFGQDFAEEWRTISSGGQGSVQTAKGMFAYATVCPLLPGQRSSLGSALPRAPSQSELSAQEYCWKIVSFVPRPNLASTAFYRESGGYFLFVLAYLLLALAAWVIAFVTLGRDRAHDRLSEDEARLREITGTMSDGLLVMDETGRLTFANPEACRLLGYVPMELLGQDMHELLHVHDDGTFCDRSECNMLQVAHTGAAYRSVEETFKCKDGTLLPVSVSAAAIVREGKVVGIVVAFRDIAERKKLQRELEWQARTDVLTGLNNRRHFFELAELELARARRHQKPLSLLMLDVDHFKQFNDTYGHHVGDAVLQKLSEVCSQTLREIDVLGRLGGEEFAVLLPETGRVQALEVAERLRLAVSDVRVPLEQGKVVSFTVSIGVAGFVAADADVDAMLRRADMALYAAKNAGRNQVCGEGCDVTETADRS